MSDIDQSDRATLLLLEQISAVPWPELGAKVTWSPAGGSVRWVDIDSIKHAAQFLAWDNGYCLDAVLVDLESESVEYLCAGTCGTEKAFRQILSKAISRVLQQVSSEAN